MIEKIITSKTRVKLLNLFLTNIDARYYLRELERLLNESLSPLRRQLLKLESMGILTAEYEANLKYYKLNKNFQGIEELKNLVLGNVAKDEAVLEIASLPSTSHNDNSYVIASEAKQSQLQPVIAGARRMKYDLWVLIFISLFVLASSMFVVYQVTELTPKAKPHTQGLASKGTLSPDEMISNNWKVKSGSMPALSSGIAGKGEKSKEI